ncbi:uncharacterized protein LOC144113186 isoform X2 [Amblyomma americanum]
MVTLQRAHVKHVFLPWCFLQLREMWPPMHDLLEPCAPLLNMVLTRLSSLLSSPSICLGLSFDSLRGGKTTVEDQRCNVKRHGLRKQAILECATAGDVKMMHELGGLGHFCGLEDHILQLGVLPLVATSSAGDRVVAGVFAACVAFDSCPPNASAAQKILTGSHAMATVHKRDYVVNFVNWFRLVDDVVLHCNLRLQTLLEGWERLRVFSLPQLKTLIASAPDTGIDNLFIAPEALRALVSSCPQ